MSGRAWDREYESHAEFYADVYGHVVREIVPAGRNGAKLMMVEQDAGDWSDAATPDLVVGVLVAGTPLIEGDIGAGRLYGRRRPGDWAVHPPGAATRSVIDTAHGFGILSVPYAGLMSFAGEHGLPPDGDFGPLHASAHSSAGVPALVKAMWREAEIGAPHGALWADGALLQLLGLLLHMKANGGREEARGGLAPWQVRRVSEYLEDHLAEDVSLSELAALLDLSTFHLCQAFKQSTGLPPHRWRQQRRIERAQALLESSNDSITEIAAAIGYDDPSQFAAAFRKAFGLTPSQYRRERRS